MHLISEIGIMEQAKQGTLSILPNWADFGFRAGLLSSSGQPSQNLAVESVPIGSATLQGFEDEIQRSSQACAM